MLDLNISFTESYVFDDFLLIEPWEQTYLLG